MNKQTVVYSHNGVLLSNRKEQTTDMHHSRDEPLMQADTWKKPGSKSCMLWFHLCDIFEWQNHRVRKQTSGCQGQRVILERDGTVLKHAWSGNYTTVCLLKHTDCTPKRVKFTVYKLYPNLKHEQETNLSKQALPPNLVITTIIKLLGNIYTYGSHCILLDSTALDDGPSDTLRPKQV